MATTRKQEGIKEQLEYVVDDINGKWQELDEIDNSCAKATDDIDGCKTRLAATAKSIFAACTARTNITLADEPDSAVNKQLAELRAESVVLTNKLNSQLSFLQHAK